MAALGDTREPEHPKGAAPLMDPDWAAEKRRRRLIWLGAGALACGLVLSAIFALNGFETSQLSSAGPAEVPLIRADERPFKVRPENPGGLEIPNRDKLIYRYLKGDGPVASVERLLSDPETPRPPPPAEAKPAPAEAASSAQSSSGASPGDPQPGETESASGGPAGSPPPPQPRPAPGSGDEETAAANPQAGYRVQLGAMRSQALATAQWERIARQHGDLLSGMSPQISRTDLGERGVLYRLRAGPLASERQARALCQELGKRRIGCLVVAPSG